MHWSIHTVGPIYDVISNKSDSEILKSSHFEVGNIANIMVKPVIKQGNRTCKFALRKNKSLDVWNISV